MSAGKDGWNDSKLVARAILHDRAARRKVIGRILLVALGMIAIGLWAIDGWLGGNPWAFVAWWGGVALLTLLARAEQIFSSARAQEALATKKAAGTTLGKPKGTIQVSMYDQDRERIATLLRLGVSQRRIVEQHLGYGTANSLRHYIRTRGLSTDAA